MIIPLAFATLAVLPPSPPSETVTKPLAPVTSTATSDCYRAKARYILSARGRWNPHRHVPGRVCG